MARIRRPVQEFPGWFHSPSGDCAIFEKAEDVPLGWANKPFTTYEAPTPPTVDVEDTIKQLTDLGVEINPIWGAAHLKKVLDDRSTSR